MIKSENKIVSIIIGLIIVFLGFWILSRPFITLFSVSIFLALAVLFRGFILFTPSLGGKMRKQNGANLFLVAYFLFLVLFF